MKTKVVKPKVKKATKAQLAQVSNDELLAILDARGITVAALTGFGKYYFGGPPYHLGIIGALTHTLRQVENVWNPEHETAVKSFLDKIIAAEDELSNQYEIVGGELKRKGGAQ